LKKKVYLGISVMTAVIMVFLSVFVAGESIAQPANVKKNIDVKKVNKKMLKLTKADLGPWVEHGNSKSSFGPKAEFPFGPCLNCLEKVGVMTLPTMSMWIKNNGGTNAPASKAKVTWESGKAPFGNKSMTVDVPPIKAGDLYLLTVNMPQGKYFQIAKPVKIEFDSTKKIDEENENDNVFKYTYK
jgi:CARDB